MSPRIGVTGVGWSGFTPTTAGRSYKELMFEAASAAYLDAGVDPRTEVDSFVCASEDVEEGTSIFDEYVPDQLGAVQRPVQTVASDGLIAVGTAVMLIRSGVANVVAVEAHSKASDVLTPGRVDAFAMDPVRVEEAVRACERIAERTGVRGKDVTPFLLSCMAERTDGESLQANLALLESNARLAGEVAASRASAARS